MMRKRKNKKLQMNLKRRRIFDKLIVTFIGLILGSRLIGGMRYLAVATNSMAPTIPQGSLIVIKKVPTTQLGIGDVITYERGSNNQVTHRITKVRADGTFQTQGDGNSSPDELSVSSQQIIGKNLISIPLLGKLSLFMRNSWGIVAIVGSLSAFWLARYLVKLSKEVKETVI